ncbi:LuxR family two component transcriptional regulator [Thermosporothrix hazakensis]|jgi:two-component system response regulator DegU|uniref:LuxR family two component transcriptional regulator n=2 Tax=Thermosporothrix TaxID=768650 RepID=A0A326UDQ5_THEHA|nr:response regulator transcription factor [Thermosporothrix hazakensis]PZW36184.1 LuxR family two component transcriptional regulator [Thermosporothrix hazakensis]BBH88649.1 DNA-binding response regulator [Thermosporothrix sp. COM3]GCE46835.1 DNA-binding response regulator [Thermosporothrix hazakensis]
MVNIIIADDHSLMRRAVREVLEKEGGFSVVAEASTGQEAAEKAEELKPDVVLMDMDMPDCDGFEATSLVLDKSPHSRVVIFTAVHEDQYVFRALQKGAMGYITKDIDSEGLLHAIQCAARNELCIPGPLASQVLAQLRRMHEPFYPSRLAASATAYRTRRSARTSVDNENDATSLTSAPTPSARPLTGREQEILDLMRKGRKNREIAGELCIAESTVHKHVQNIFEKLHARNRTEAIYFTSQGLQL